MKASFASAGQFPLKLLTLRGLVERIKHGEIPPVHVQFIPTNRCNLKCGFCSCRARDREQEMSLDEAREMLRTFVRLGMETMTITGGGEPCLWGPLSEFIGLAVAEGVGVGLVTNGTKLSGLKASAVEQLAWCRISCSDEANRIGTFWTVVEAAKSVDWAFSYVFTAAPDMANFHEHVKFAREHKFTHMRAVSNITDLESAPDMEAVRLLTRETAGDLEMIYQDRQTFTRGAERCLISLLKPVIGPDGKLYPCCGVQYARGEMDLSLPDAMCMGSVGEARQIWAQQRAFDGRVCERCYYDGYNGLMEMVQGRLKHEAFV